MSLQRRLTLYFILIVILPLALAGFLVQRVVSDEAERRSLLALEPALESSLAAFQERVPVDRGLVSSRVDAPGYRRMLAARDRMGIESFLTRALHEGGGSLDFLIALDPDGDELAFARTPSLFADGFREPGSDEIVAVASGGAGLGFVSSGRIPVRDERGRELGSILGGFWVDRELLYGSSDGEVEVSIVGPGSVIATTEHIEPGGFELVTAPLEVSLEDASTARTQELSDDLAIVAWTPEGPLQALSRRVLVSMGALLLLALLPTTILAYWLARLMTRPLEELTLGARAIAQGDFHHTIPVRSHDEVGQLASSFNDMTGRLRATVDELYASRDRLQRAVRRVGETLRSTHNMRSMLDSLVNTAADAVDADAAMLWTLTPSRQELYAVISSDAPEEELRRVPLGAGVVGVVAERGTWIMRPSEGGGPRPSAAEPAHPVEIAVPLYSQDRIMAVMSLYRTSSERPFTKENLDTVVFLAEQGGVAMENVLLHEEAQRLSITDGLTGVWNRRYFQMQFRQVLATAVRFDRSFTLLLLDLDNFKNVNDTYGHQRGDAILIEFAQRVSSVLREVDTVARYGGEEFVCLLSETDLSGGLTTAEKILNVVRSQPFGAVGEEPIRVTVSVGVASYPEHGDSHRTLVEAADQALYRAKQEGRDRARAAGGGPPHLKIAT